MVMHPVVTMGVGIAEGVDHALAVPKVDRVAEELDIAAVGGPLLKRSACAIRAAIVDDQHLGGETQAPCPGQG